MCMTLAFAWGTGGIVATCTRHNLFEKGGTRVPVDAGGKIIRTPNGWAVTTGELVTMLTGLRVLERFEGEEGRAGIRQVHGRIAPYLRSHRPTVDPSKSCFLSLRSIEGTFGVEAIYPDGSGVDWSPVPRVMVTWPEKMDAEAKSDLLGRRDGQGALESLTRLKRLDQLVNKIASWFAFAAERDDSMAPTMEIGVLVSGRALYARGKAADIAVDRWPLGRFALPPDRPAFPEAEAEALFFGSPDKPGLYTVDPRFPTYCLEAA